MILVIVSLIYVAKQLRQNTDILRVNGASEWLQRDYEIVEPIIDNREFAEIWLKGDQEFDTLDNVDKNRLIMFERRALGAWYHEFNMHAQKLSAGYRWREVEWLVQNLGRRQAIREAWRAFKGAYDEPFQEFMDTHLAIAESTLAKE